MDMSFANQFMAHLSLIQSKERGTKLPCKVIELPASVDEEIARLKLDTMDLNIDTLTPEQEKYARDYSAGT